MDNYFEESLRNFTFDIVSGDAIRHLAAKGMTVSQISENLTYPTDIDKIRNTVWNYYLDNGIVRLDKPDSNACITQTKYVSERDRYGHVSFRKVSEIQSKDRIQYVACDFGKRLYNDRDNLMVILDKMEDSDREYILGLPWPLEIVYHVRNDRMKRIMQFFD